MAHSCIPSYAEGMGRRIASEASLGKNLRQHLEKAKRVGGIAQVVEHLPSCTST
jgi:hypothetical protein